MIEIKLSKKWCNRTLTVVNFPYTLFVIYHNFLEDKVGELRTILIHIQTLFSGMSLFSYITLTQNQTNTPEQTLVFQILCILLNLLVPIGIGAMYLFSEISNNISISCRCEDE